MFLVNMQTDMDVPIAVSIVYTMNASHIYSVIIPMYFPRTLSTQKNHRYCCFSEIKTSKPFENNMSNKNVISPGWNLTLKIWLGVNWTIFGHLFLVFINYHTTKLLRNPSKLMNLLRYMHTNHFMNQLVVLDAF